MFPHQVLYIFMGPPGSGKGTLSSLCLEHLGWKQLSTGNLCRKHIIEGTEIGKRIDFALKSGKLVSDSLITSMVIEWLGHADIRTSPIIFDGYPRTSFQAKEFEDHMRATDGVFESKVIRLQASDDVIIERLSKRFTCSNRNCQSVYSAQEHSLLRPTLEGVCDRCNTVLIKRADDNPESVIERLATYRRFEDELLGFYEQNKYPIIEVDVEKSINQVFDEFKQMVCLI